MSATIRSLVIPVSDLDAAKAVYTALLGAVAVGVVGSAWWGPRRSASDPLTTRVSG